MSFHTAKSRFSSVSGNILNEVDELPVPYFWEGVEVIYSRGQWDFWILGTDGFLDGQEDGVLKILAKSWSDLMEFSASHQRVVIGRTVSTPFGDDPIVLRVHLAERDEGTSTDGMEMTLILEKVSNVSFVSAEKDATLLALQLSTPTTFGELARYCKKGLVGQGVHGDA
jgi:hypothetical protein